MSKISLATGFLFLLIIAVSWIDSPNLEFKKKFTSQEITKLLKNNGLIRRGKNMDAFQQFPSDWSYMQRAYPFERISKEKQEIALKHAKNLNKSKERAGEVWELAGPTNIPGRITDIAVDTSGSPYIIYAASAGGGVFKSTDYGVNWTPIFDDVGMLAIGSIAINPQNTDIIYVGTGEANGSVSSYEGNGIYKTIDAGLTWNYSGLPESYHIGRIVVDPLRPDTVYAAVSGIHMGGANPERGLYRSIDAGATWQQKLYVSDSTSCIDVALHPSTGTVFAAMWEKVRIRGDYIRWGGTTSGLWRSSDNGDTWMDLSGVGGYVPHSDHVGRIGVTVDPNSNTVYSSILNTNTNELQAILKSGNLGSIWMQTNISSIASLISSFGWYFGQIRVAPGNPEIVYFLDIHLFMSNDGGAAYFPTEDNIHVDHHALALIPNQSEPGYYHAFEGCDGGVNYRNKQTSAWTTGNMANTQFYAIRIDPSNPDRIYGGTQDNGTMRTPDGGLDNWDHILGGDGFYVLIDPNDPDIIWAEYQYGMLFKSTNGGLNWAQYAGGDPWDRHNWNTPIAMDPQTSTTIYYGSNNMFRYTAETHWGQISGDLTNGPYENTNYHTFGTISTIDVAHNNTDIIYVGTDDGNVWVTQNGGIDWTQINTGLPERYITRVTVDPRDDATVFVSLSGYGSGEKIPHLFRSTNFGADWESIAGDMPDAPINDVIPDPHPLAPNTIWIATDFGVYETIDMGQTWVLLGDGMPIVSVHDIDFHPRTRTLAAGTHGRSIYKTIMECPDVVDSDGDGIMDACDNCPDIENPDLEDAD
ncbi:MAG: hypothetical protein GY865_06610, partial [candidate division Zixibacteria bacterium]|nr:hypothetical protein [candidate division Zixibacteria bacterium]